MTIIEAITRVDTVKPNTYSQTEKIKWLSELDGIIKAEIIDTHEGGENVAFSGYTAETDLNTKLLVPAPYDEVYVRYLEMQIDYANNEYGKYNNSMVMYNSVYTAFEKYYNRDHMPISRGRRFIF
jgi:hypothetical protein